jgi:hypothetical protein
LLQEIREERLTRGAEEDLRRAVQIKPHAQDSIDRRAPLRTSPTTRCLVDAGEFSKPAA